jgi:predicted membrane protein DUF2157
VKEPSPPGEQAGKTQAQRRADRIRAFRDELDQLERDGVLTLSGEQRQGLRSYHDRTLQDLARRYDIDVSDAQRQMSWGMRIASFLGALALCAAAYLFFYRFWGNLSTFQQVAILVAAPLLALIVTEVAARRERTLYVASLSALVAFACFILNLQVLGLIFNLRPTPNALLAFSAFAFLLAYAYGLRVLLLGGIGCLLGWVAATAVSLGGASWFSFGQRPENFILAGLALLGIPLVFRHAERDGFPAIYRVTGLLAILVPIFILSNFGEGSYLPWARETVEGVHQAAGFAVSAAAIGIGIRRRWTGMVNAGGVFFVIFLFAKFVDWWWDWMPKYLFFLVLGLAAIAILAALKKLRALNARAAA